MAANQTLREAAAGQASDGPSLRWAAASESRRSKLRLSHSVTPCLRPPSLCLTATVTLTGPSLRCQWAGSGLLQRPRLGRAALRCAEPAQPQARNAGPGARTDGPCIHLVSAPPAVTRPGSGPPCRCRPGPPCRCRAVQACPLAPPRLAVADLESCSGSLPARPKMRPGPAGAGSLKPRPAGCPVLRDAWSLGPRPRDDRTGSLEPRWQGPQRRARPAAASAARAGSGPGPVNGSQGPMTPGRPLGGPGGSTIRLGLLGSGRGALGRRGEGDPGWRKG